MIKKNKNKGFTLIEIVVAMGILVMIAGMSIVSLSAIPKARAKKTSEDIQTYYMFSRDYAKVHGGKNASFQICLENDSTSKEYGSLKIVSKRGKTEEISYIPNGIKIFYNSGNFEDDLTVEHELGNTDSKMVKDANGIVINFSPEGRAVGPVFLNWLSIRAGSKEFKYMFTSNGQIINDYEYEDTTINGAPIQLSADWAAKNGGANIGNTGTADSIIVPLPGLLYGSNVLTENGKVQQPPLVYDSDLMQISGEYRAKDKNAPGESYKIIFTLKTSDNLNMKWEGDNKPSNVSVKCDPPYQYVILEPDPQHPGYKRAVLHWYIK